MRVLVIFAVLGLAACGVDGEPAPHSGVDVGGDAQIGVVGAL